MPFELKELAAISGMPGLYRLLRPATRGVLVENLAEHPIRTLAPARNKVSLLSEISIYTQDPDVTVPLGEVFDRLYKQHGTGLTLTAKSSESELSKFLADAIPDYDRQRVYQSDIRKLVTWYSLVSKFCPYHEAPQAEAEGTDPIAEKPLSTGGLIAEQEAGADSTPTTNPEAGTTAQA